MVTEQGRDTETVSKGKHPRLVGKEGQAEDICGGRSAGVLKRTSWLMALLLLAI